jgi:putative SOS response-associated peptidase YedK
MQRPIDARSETAAKSGMFRGALSQRRRIVAADAFYEWKVVEGGKQPYAIARQDAAYGKGFAAAFLLAVTSYGGGTRAQIPTARSPITNSGVGD